MGKIGRVISTGAATPALVTLPSGRKTRKWAVKEYQAVQRKSDGKFTWRLVREVVGMSRTGDSEPLGLCKDAKEYAEKNGYKYIPGVKQNQEAELTLMEQIALAAEQ